MTAGLRPKMRDWLSKEYRFYHLGLSFLNLLNLRFPDYSKQKLLLDWNHGQLCFSDILVLSLPFRADRRKAAYSNFSQYLGIEFEFVDSFYGKLLEVSDIPSEILTDRSKEYLSLGSVGCLLTHLAVWKTVAQSQSGFTLILEDDCVPCPTFRTVLNACHTEIPSDCDVLFVGGKSKAKWNIKNRVNKYIFELSHFIRGTYGYAITPNGAEKMIEFGLPVDLTCGGVDDLIGVVLRSRHLKAYHTNPSIVKVDYSLESDIYNRYKPNKNYSTTVK